MNSTKKRYEYQPTDLEIYKAAYNNDWKSVRVTFQLCPELRTKPITQRLETPLMIAVNTNQSHEFVKTLLSSLFEDQLISSALVEENNEGDTALHYAAKIGNMIDAKLLVGYSNKPEIALHRNQNGSTPLLYATWPGKNKEMLDLLLSTIDGISKYPITETSYYEDFLTPAIEAEFLDIALELVEMYSKREIWNSQRPLNVLARKPKLFRSGSSLGFWSRHIYSLLRVDESKVIFDEKKATQQHAHDEKSISISMDCTCCTSTTPWFKKILLYLGSPIKNIYNMKIRHIQAEQLVQRICNIVTEKNDQHIVSMILESTIATAIECGNYEVIKGCILAYPSIIWDNIEGSYNLFHEAIKQRQEQVCIFVYHMSSYKEFVATHTDHNTRENALHVAAKLAAPHRLNTITGAALRMQRELQWFEEIKKLVGPSQKEAFNIENKTPRMVFTEEHKKLLKEGQEWMKETASASSLVAALIVTVAFAAAFTLPGGEKNEGKLAFMVFIISDAIAFFSSSTSVLMYLGILTSRYAEDDFLYVLPRRLMIGLVSLFLSLAATMIAFSATLALMLQDKVPGIAAPLVIITSIPVVLFGMQQFPLLVEIVYSTYGPSIFRKKNKRMTKYKTT